MIKAKELRIGNLVSSNGESIYLWELGNFELIHDGTNEMSMFSPIPLTAEWLRKFGFSLYGGSYLLNEVAIFENYNHEKSWVLDARGFSLGKDFKYVHQLQNLYYALTWEELTLK